jgi:hypothetical protein
MQAPKGFSTDSDIFDGARSWQWRTIRASLGTTTGAIVQAMLAKQPKNGPALGLTCDITAEGMVETLVREKKGRLFLPPQRMVIGSVIDVRDNLRRLCDHCKLDDKDRVAFFAEFQKWIRKDYRAKSEV